jgi:hypothetical protein
VPLEDEPLAPPRSLWDLFVVSEFCSRRVAISPFPPRSKS